MNPIALFFSVLAIGVLPFAVGDLIFNSLDLLAVISLVLGVGIQLRRPPRKASR